MIIIIIILLLPLKLLGINRMINTHVSKKWHYKYKTCAIDLLEFKKMHDIVLQKIRLNVYIYIYNLIFLTELWKETRVR